MKAESWGFLSFSFFEDHFPVALATVTRHRCSTQHHPSNYEGWVQWRVGGHPHFSANANTTNVYMMKTSADAAKEYRDKNKREKEQVEQEEREEREQREQEE